MQDAIHELLDYMKKVDIPVVLTKTETITSRDDEDPLQSAREAARAKGCTKLSCALLYARTLAALIYVHKDLLPTQLCTVSATFLADP